MRDTDITSQIEGTEFEDAQIIRRSADAEKQRVRRQEVRSQLQESQGSPVSPISG